MSILNNSKFNVIRGWDIASASSITPSLVPGTGLTFSPGMFGRLHTDGTLIFPGAPDPAWQPLYCVVTGNTANEFDAQYVGKVLCLRGAFTITTDIYDSTGPAVGAAVTVNASGQIVAAGANYRVGFVLANDHVAKGTITVECNI